MQNGSTSFSVNRKTQMAVALISIVGLWVLLAWPLPRYARHGIPYAPHAPAGEAPRAMVSGDHLQLMYHFWLLRDMVAGTTPWMYNLYEFNTGDDGERYRPGAYFAPFSWAFTVGDWAAGRAMGWHMATWLSLLIAFWSSWRLARRYSDDEVVAWSVALMVTAFPYRWLNLLGGSPTGFGMAWTPLLMLGLDRAIRDGSWRGGWLACLAMLGSGWAEKHVMLFNALLVPGWSLVLLLGERPWRRNVGWPACRRALAAGPAALGIVLSYLYARLYTAHLGASAMAQGRTTGEVAAFSPHLEGFWNRHLTDISSQLFPGWLLPVVLGIGLLVWLYRSTIRRDSSVPSHGLVMVGLLLVGAVVILLAPGPHGRGVGRDLFDLVRELIPPYRMIRQPAKIMLLLPALLVPLLAVTLSLFPRRSLFALASAALIVADIALWARPSICLLDQDNGAYAAVARDAQVSGEPPRVLVLPLWPGDSHYTSAYQYFASLHHIRLANGYSPVVSRSYLDDFFNVFQTANQGSLSDEQLDDLQRRGLHHLLLHEDLFPEKVSPFPVAVTLQRLLQNPRLDLLARDGSVWAFRIIASAAPMRPSAENPVYLPARLLEAESAHRRGGTLVEDRDASGGKAVRVEGVADKVEFSIARLAGAEGLAWWFRVRGAGQLQVTTYAGLQEAPVSQVPVQAETWTWIRAPMIPIVEYSDAGMAVRGLEGSIEIDRALISDTQWPLITKPGWSIRIPASDFFHAGATEKDGPSVLIRPRYEPARIVLYGPRLPISPGTYEVELEFASDAPSGTVLGTFLAGRNEKAPDLTTVDVRAGNLAQLHWTQLSHDLLYTGFRFSRAAEIEVKAVRITRTDGP
jgi:hypothetical protein